jgi:hypothetical protein
MRRESLLAVTPHNLKNLELRRLRRSLCYDKFMPSVKNILGGTFEDVGEAIVKPVVDEVGRAIETGTQAIVYGANPPGQDPQQQVANRPSAEKKEEDRQTKISKWRWYLQKHQEQQSAQDKVRQDNKQKQFQEAQVVQQEQQTKTLEVQKKKENIALRQATHKTESKGSIGG